MNKTYRGKPTKRRKKESNKLKATIICAVIGAGLLNALISGFSSQSYVVSDNTAKAQEGVPMTLQTTTVTEPRDFKMIKIKTDYYDNERTVYMASEQACNYVGLSDKCIEDLMGIAYAESRSFNYRAEGDGNKSYGAFQIHFGYHPEITKEQATDPYWAAKWTIKRMLAYGYLQNRDYAIMKHNGTPYTAKTLTYLSIVNKYINM